MVPAETKRASRNARYKRTRNALERALSEVVRSRTRTTFLSLSFTKKRKERERAQKRAKRRREKTETTRVREYLQVFTKICMIIVRVFMRVSVRHKSGDLLHFVGENDINVSRTQRDRKRASLSPNSKATTQEDCSSRRFFPSRAK